MHDDKVDIFDMNAMHTDYILNFDKKYYHDDVSALKLPEEA